VHSSPAIYASILLLADSHQGHLGLLNSSFII
jgi:hypothetical protein